MVEIASERDYLENSSADPIAFIDEGKSRGKNLKVSAFERV